MFFVLSKILFFIIQPIMWLIGLLSWAFFTKNDVKKRKILRGVFFMTVVLTNPFLMNQTYKLYETPVVPISSLRDTFDIAIVLGGFSNFNTTANDRLNFGPSVNRLTDAIDLYKKGLVRKLLISGGDGSLLGQKSAEALRVEPFLLAMCVRQEDILLESNSRNTHENALFSKQLIDSLQPNTSKLLLITSASHMPRSMGCFRKVGLEVKAFPAHFVGEKPSWDTGYWLKPNSQAFVNWETIIKEWIGYVVYSLQGYI
jgi:uncharacterized SAM-binding protein YcdF (DUF218 family)